MTKVARRSGQIQAGHRLSLAGGATETGFSARFFLRISITCSVLNPVWAASSSTGRCCFRRMNWVLSVSGNFLPWGLLEFPNDNGKK